MPGYNAEATERIKILSTVLTSGVLAASNSRQTATIDMGNFRRLVVIGTVIGTAATTTVPHATIKILDSTALGSAVHTAIVSRTIMVQTAGLSKWKILEMRDEDITQNIASPGSTIGRFVRVREVWGTRPTQIGFTVLGLDARFEPHSNTVSLG